MLGVGSPDAAAVRVTVPPTGTLWLAGWRVMTGEDSAGGGVIWDKPEVTVRRAERVVAAPPSLLKTARYS
jgi:hypothetical protein